MNFSKWVGRQSARLKQGQMYFAIITATMSVISLLELAFDLDFVFLLALAPGLLGMTWLFGYILDKKGIVSEDLWKATEMAARKWSPADEKSARVIIAANVPILASLCNVTVEKAREMLDVELARVREGWKKCQKM